MSVYERDINAAVKQQENNYIQEKFPYHNSPGFFDHRVSQNCRHFFTEISIKRRRPFFEFYFYGSSRIHQGL
jgi:hypothetical protein